MLPSACAVRFACPVACLVPDNTQYSRLKRWDHMTGAHRDEGRTRGRTNFARQDANAADGHLKGAACILRDCDWARDSAYVCPELQ
jgi:hypothetical protein